MKDISKISDAEWLNIHIKGLYDPNKYNIPLLPSQKIQIEWNGSFGEIALRQGFDFYRKLKKESKPFNNHTRILDFGCGWGRISRFFAKDIDKNNFYGVDICPEIIRICKESHLRGNYFVINYAPPISFNDNYFDIIFAYSVFTHLPEELSLRWIKEFSRILKPEGCLFITIWEEALIKKMISHFYTRKDELSGSARKIFSSLNNSRLNINDNKKEKYLFYPIEEVPKDIYGIAFISSSYIKNKWTKYFKLRFLRDKTEQITIMMKKQKEKRNCKILVYLKNIIGKIIIIIKNISWGIIGIIKLKLFKNKIICTACIIFYSILFSLKATLLVIIKLNIFKIEDVFSNIIRNSSNNDIKLIAFYLPQFHPIPENDKWWGKGFTEWINVKKAKPLFNNIFKQHYQPRIPSDEIGWYNLLDPNIQRKQIKLAKEYGIYGFCFYHYWFNGKKLLEKPVEAFIKNKDLDFPFCLCWANEPWTRKWDGLDHHILQPQTYGDKKDWIAHFNYLLPALKDKRSIKIDNKPIFLIYRIGHIDNVNKMIQCWREQAEINGLEGLYVIAARGGFPDSLDYLDKNIDAIFDFAPNCLVWEKSPRNWNPLYKYDPLQKYDYDSYWQSLLKCEKKYSVHFRGAFVSFDNTPRTGKNAIMLFGANPNKYRIYLKKLVEKVIKEPEKDKLLFINAWNEWGEGCYLEPDKKYGRAFLEATKKALGK